MDLSFRKKIILSVITPIVAIIAIFVVLTYNNSIDTFENDLKHYQTDIKQAKRYHLKSLVSLALNTIKEPVATGNKEQAIDIINTLNFDSTNYFFIMTLDGIALANGRNPAIRGKDLSKNKSVLKQIESVTKKDGYLTYLSGRPGDNSAIYEKMAYLEMIPGTNWYIGTGFYIDEIAHTIQEKRLNGETKLNSFIRNLIFVSLCSLAIVIALALVFVKQLYKIIGGEPYEIESVVKRIASGDFTSTSSKTVDPTGIYGAVQQMVNKLKSIIYDINDASSTLNTSAETMINSAHSVKEDSQTQMEQLELTATAMNQMTFTAEEVARNALEASNSTQKANENANQGNEIVASMNESITSLVSGMQEVEQVITELEDKTMGIGSILDVIRGISEQTNLLALNAAIEAARAGEQGRGFAVVADEVRHLATRTQQSTDEIQLMITQLQNSAKQSVSLMGTNTQGAQSTYEKSVTARKALEDIRESISFIENMNTQIATAAEEQTNVATDINKSIVSIRDLANKTAASSDGTLENANELSTISHELQQAVKAFKLD
ncbi:methyl-accepting chemotaxis protein [Pseudoalteromonas sp. A601]|uniref:methyl-accepting chemotaxis protein n=1 Tax=Pseudoalteromonas sp. A601 TaxID=1967839 RepID=UPI0015942977|nr:methyl-accepting chemotaxis protein [Pseudoalteromonas sp. A601]